MNIAIHPQGVELPDQVRAYIEYRIFSAISRFGRRCVRVSVRLEECDVTQVRTRYRCAVALHLTPFGQVRVRATADGLYAVVDESAERLSRGAERRLSATDPEDGTKAIRRNS
jgi:ribosomal subunit interface protein